MKILIVDDTPAWVEHHKKSLLSHKEAEIHTAFCAKEGLSKIEVNIDKPYDIIISDLQMESDFLPKYAGQWFIEQIKMFREYDKSKIYIISATSDIKSIAEKLKVNYIPKYLCTNIERYKIILND